MENCTNQDKKDAYTYLDLRIKATPEGADIKGYLRTDVIEIDSYLLTTGRTWGSLFRCRYSYVEGKGYALSSM